MMVSAQFLYSVDHYWYTYLVNLKELENKFTKQKVQTKFLRGRL